MTAVDRLEEEAGTEWCTGDSHNKNVRYNKQPALLRGIALGREPPLRPTTMQER